MNTSDPIHIFALCAAVYVAIVLIGQLLAITIGRLPKVKQTTVTRRSLAAGMIFPAVVLIVLIYLLA